MEKRKAAAHSLALIGLLLLAGFAGNVDLGRGSDLLTLSAGILTAGLGYLWIRALENLEENISRRAETRKGNGYVCK